MPIYRQFITIRCMHLVAVASCLAVLCAADLAMAQKTAKPVLHGKHWVAITGKPLAATAGGMTFTRGGNAVDAACAMLAATSTMWDTLGWGGETQQWISGSSPKAGSKSDPWATAGENVPGRVRARPGC